MPPKTDERLDLRDEVTVFVLTVGAPSYPECIRRLEAQDSRFRLDVIDHVAPMSRALQCMPDRCRTPYFVQVDEDMILYPHAIRSLYTRLIASPPEVAILTCHLHDHLAARVLYGLKIYRHAIVRDYPYRDVESCEYDQIRRFTADGFIDMRLPLPDHFQPSELTLGDHGFNWTPFSVFERYQTLERKIRRHHAGAPTTSATWVEEHAHFFLRRYLEEGSPLDLYALMGVLAGRLAPVDGRGQEKDYREYDRLPGFETLVRFVAESAAGAPPARATVPAASEPVRSAAAARGGRKR